MTREDQIDGARKDLKLALAGPCLLGINMAFNGLTPWGIAVPGGTFSALIYVYLLCLSLPAVFTVFRACGEIRSDRLRRGLFAVSGFLVAAHVAATAALGFRMFTTVRYQEGGDLIAFLTAFATACAPALVRLGFGDR